jgi:hypothetical protein
VRHKAAARAARWKPPSASGWLSPSAQLPLGIDIKPRMDHARTRRFMPLCMGLVTGYRYHPLPVWRFPHIGTALGKNVTRKIHFDERRTPIIHSKLLSISKTAAGLVHAVNQRNN